MESCNYERHLKNILSDVQAQRLALNTMLKQKDILQLFCHIGRCQDLVYTHFNQVDNDGTKKLHKVTNGGKSTLKQLFESVSIMLESKCVVACSTPITIPECAGDLYDDVLEFLLLSHFDCFLSKTTHVKQYKLDVQVLWDVGGAIHDGWALKTYFTGYATKSMKFDPRVATERSDKFVLYQDLSGPDTKVVDLLSYCAIVYAMQQMPTQASQVLNKLEKIRRNAFD